MSPVKVVLTGVRWLLDAPRFITRLVTVETARALLLRIAAAAEPGPGPRQLLADVSVISREDSGTGIQRVVRQLLRQLIANPPQGFVVRPVYATYWRSFRYADQYQAALTGQKPGNVLTGKVVVRAGDVFLGMDLAAHFLPRYPFTLARWKAAGVRFHFLVYDLLPALHPEWFTSSGVSSYRDWIRTMAIFADGAICISRSVADELRRWLTDTYGKTVGESIPASWFHLSGEIPVDTPSRIPPEGETAGLLNRIGKRSSILMVGTIEPRKGYAQALSAFETLWHAGHDVNLIIVGRVGWKVEGLLGRMRSHPEAGNRLIWIEDATDEMLCALYGAVDGLLMASEGEGFGLPIVEAARRGKPILARDIPVFREIIGDNACYFNGAFPNELVAELANWLALVSKGQAPASEKINQLTWQESARQLTCNLVEQTGATRHS